MQNQHSKFLISKPLFIIILLAISGFGLQKGATPAHAATIIHVNLNASGTNNGTTWKNAYTDLQSALTAATAGDEIWVAAGIYVPATTFTLADGVAVYGGFEANETARTQRDWETNITVLSGDIGGDDTTDSNGVVTDVGNIVGTNVQTVVTGSNLSNTTVLDGFTITAGKNTQFGGSAKGGGLEIQSGSPVIKNVNFVGNFGLRGSGFYINTSGTPIISNITMTNNTGSIGGAIFITGGTNLTISDSRFIENKSTFAAGAIYIESSDPTITNSVISGNEAINGGGVFIKNGADPTFYNVLISGNQVTGGTSDAGGIYIEQSDASIINTTITGNSATRAGGILNFRGNVVVQNSVVWGNEDTLSPISSSVNTFALSSTTFTNSIIEGLGGSVAWSNSSQNQFNIDGGSNLDTNPLFTYGIAASDAPTTNGDFTLQPNSPAINFGNSALYTSSSNNDLAGNSRINGSAIDLGAYESNFVALNITIAGTGAGTVMATGINCPSDCSEHYTQNTMVTLTILPATGSNFAGWSGATGCSNSGTCTVTMDSAKNVTAAFNLSSYKLITVVSPSNGGTLESGPTGIDCPSDCDEWYLYGTTVVLTPTATSGFEFIGWAGAGGCTGLGPCNVTVDQSKLVRADFAEIFTLTTNKSGNGSGTVSSNPVGINCGSSCSMSATDGTTITLTATPTNGSTFTGWSGGGCTGTGTCTVSLDASKTVTASFEPVFDLTINKTGSGTGTVSSQPTGINCGPVCTVTKQANTMFLLTASPDPGSVFSGWSGGGCSGTSNSCIVTVDATKTVSANFEELFELTVTKSGDGLGTVTSSPAGIDCGATCSMLVPDGDSVTLAAVAGNNSVFVGWSISKCDGSLTCPVLVDEAKNIVATFAPLYDLTVVPTGEGSGSITDDSNTIDCVPVCSLTEIGGTVITLTATADNGSIFTGWSGTSCTGSEAECVFPLNATETITATFAPLYDLNVAKGGTGAGTILSMPTGIDCGITCTLSAASGTMITLTATADSGSVFDGWVGSGCAGTGLCVAPLTATQSVTATFTDSPTARDLTVTTSGNGTGAITSSPAGIDCGTTCAMSVADGTLVTLAATADDGSVFSGWSGGGCSGTAPCTVTLDTSKSVTAEFQQVVASGGYQIYLPLITRP